MHKCPPAEACRDAFERMSKATVQMCLSTTGFGSQVAAWRRSSMTFQTPTSNSRLPRGNPVEQQRQQTSRNATIRRATQSRQQQRALPKFDMNLEDLFGGNNNTSAPSTNNRAAAAKSSAYTRPPQPSEYANTSEPSIVVPVDQSYPQRANSMEYFPNTDSSPQAGQYYYGGSPQSAQSPASMPPTYPSQYGAGNSGFSAEQRQDSLPETAMDLGYLDPQSQGDYGSGFVAPPAFPDFGNGVGQDVGIDLGFGLSVDFQHDWSEGANYDLLEGFFFGGGQGIWN